MNKKESKTFEVSYKNWKAEGSIQRNWGIYIKNIHIFLYLQKNITNDQLCMTYTALQQIPDLQSFYFCFCFLGSTFGSCSKLNPIISHPIDFWPGIEDSQVQLQEKVWLMIVFHFAPLLSYFLSPGFFCSLIDGLFCSLLPSPALQNYQWCIGFLIFIRFSSHVSFF